MSASWRIGHSECGAGPAGDNGGGIAATGFLQNVDEQGGSMRVPGFGAEATIYKSQIAYQAVWASGEATGLDTAMPMLSVGEGICQPFCELCESDINSRTGCSQSCTAKNCNEYTRPCTGCSNPCEGGLLCRGVCTDPLTDPKNCGTCGNACPPGVSCQHG